uniref:Uncharacterized protein n=1 Tax=Aureoumbra lagunensis TaxID=44058 RepID=A0A7S3NPY4_9STRA|mmetsp:Transcript_19228/g.24951  ORF Transcript_19228/g.24951 Transcript_19228/m.24951 type:complete len:239 (+) Transcript_19228:33-749(+)
MNVKFLDILVLVLWHGQGWQLRVENKQRWTCSLRRTAVKPGDAVLAERLYPASYVQPLRKTVGGIERAQWLADWRAISECFARLPAIYRIGDDSISWEQTRLASTLRDACSEELSFMPSRIVEQSGRLPSPFALSLIDAAFCAAYTRPERYSRIREYTLGQYVPNRFADVSERIGAHRVAAVARSGQSTSAVGRWFDPATPEFHAMVRCHNVEYPIKYPDWRKSDQYFENIVLHEPCD